jgi:hypothetical protein
MPATVTINFANNSATVALPAFSIQLYGQAIDFTPMGQRTGSDSGCI